MDIEEFLASGDFVETKKGPHFCQVGKRYVLIFNGLGYLLQVTSTTMLDGKRTVVFQPIDGWNPPPFGVVKDLQEIFDTP